MKKFLVILGVIFLTQFCPTKSEAGIKDWIDKVPTNKQGVAYSLVDNGFNYLTTFELAKWKFLSFELGYAGKRKNTGDKAVAVISANILNLKKMGVQLPLADLVDVNVGAYFGYGRIQLNDGFDNGNNEQDFGISATLLTLKF